VRIRPRVVHVSSCIDGFVCRRGTWGCSTTHTVCWESSLCTGKQGSAKSGGKAPAVHELRCVSGHESYMRRLVLMGTCAGGVLGEATRFTPCGDRRRFAPENPAWPSRGGHRTGPPASFDISLCTWRTSLSVQVHMQVHRSASVHAVCPHVQRGVRRGLLGGRRPSLGLVWHSARSDTATIGM
jgi:hypothetical protein